MSKVLSLRIEEKKLNALVQINEATKISIPELVRQGVDQVIETYQIYIPDAQFRKELGLVISDSKDYLRRLANEKD